MWLQGIGKEKGSNSDSRRDAFRDTGTSQGSFWPGVVASFPAGTTGRCRRRTKINRRRSVGMDGGENRFWGGSDPTLSGMGAAQRLRRRGSLPPKLSSRFPRSVAGGVVGQALRNFELHQPEENIWP